MKVGLIADEFSLCCRAVSLLLPFSPPMMNDGADIHAPLNLAMQEHAAAAPVVPPPQEAFPMAHMSDSSPQIRVQATPAAAVPTAIYGLQMEGDEPQCGLPCKYCHAQAPVCVGAGGLGAGMPPPELEGLYSEAQWKLLKQRVDDTYDSTAFPFMPCMFTHLCVPFSPICVMCCCASRRTNQLREHFEEENTRLKPQGLEWIVAPLRPRMPYVLRWLPEIRPQFEAREPGARQYVRWGLPPMFWLEADKKAWHELLLASPNPGSSPAAGDGNDERSRLFRIHLQRRLMLEANMNIEALGIFFSPQQQQPSSMQQQMQMQSRLQGPPQQQTMEGAIELQQRMAANQQQAGTGQQQQQQAQRPSPVIQVQPQQPYMQSQQLFMPSQPYYAQPPQSLYMQQQQPLYAAPPLQQQQYPSEGVPMQPSQAWPSQSTDAFSQQSTVVAALSPPGGPSLYSNSAASPMGTPAGETSSSSTVVKRFCAACGAAKADPRSPLCMACGVCS